MSSSSRAVRDSSHQAADVRAGRPGLRWWTRALLATRRGLSCADRFKWVDKYPDSEWLRRDIGLPEDVAARTRDRIDEIRCRHSGWL